METFVISKKTQNKNVSLYYGFKFIFIWMVFSNWVQLFVEIKAQIKFQTHNYF